MPVDTKFYRGTSSVELGGLAGSSPNDLIGQSFKQDGVMSTSTDFAVAKSFQKDLFITIDAPTGSKALDIAPLSYFPESEILFNAGQEMVITDAKYQGGVMNITVTPK